MTTGVGGRIVWVEEFVLLDAEVPAASAIDAMERSGASWVVIHRRGAEYFYAFRTSELKTWMPLVRGRTKAGWEHQPFATILDLRETLQSTRVGTRQGPCTIDRSWRMDAVAPSIGRYVEVAPNGRPVAIGYAATGTRGRPRGAPAGVTGAAPPPPPAPPHPPPPTAAMGPPPSQDAVESEGTTPVRYPSIAADRPLMPDTDVVLTIDLLRAPDAATQGGPVDLGPQPDDWKEIALTVVVSSPALDMTGGPHGTIIVRRGQTSIAATVPVHVLPGAMIGSAVAIEAMFFLGTRYCGRAQRMFTIGAPLPGGAHESTPTQGTIAPQPKAVPPDVTVRISKDGAGGLDWIVETARFDGLPGKLREKVTLAAIDADVTALFKAFATLEPGKHVRAIEGFGSSLWKLAPRMFRDVYWALWDHYKRPLTFQFITNEPNLPWELMRPAREDESEVHAPLALAHPVARWLEDFDGYMRNALPGGRICTIAPKYATVSRRLPRALAESQRLVDMFGATPVAGTHAAVLALLETPPAPNVGMLHFAGHGEFLPAAATESNIKLEDGSLTASEISRPEVRLGRTCRTVVFFNACEVGAAGTMLGSVGGWAAAFLGRQFGGFIAPLWSVEDEDASVVAEEVVDGALRRHEPIGQLLTSIRAKHGAESPTFYSYLYYGDVTASLGS